MCLDAALTEEEEEEVRHSEAEEVVVGGRLHAVVSRDDHARADVSDETGEEDERVDEGEDDGGHQVLAARSQVVQQELLQRRVPRHVDVLYHRRVVHPGS